MKVQALTAMILGACLSASALAGQSGFYVGGSVGRYNFKPNDASRSFDGSQLGVFAGYKLDRFIAVEVGYAGQLQSQETFSFGGLSGTVKARSDVYTATINPMLPLGDTFSLYAKLGWSYVSTDVAFSGGGVQLKDSNSDNQFTWGAGVEINTHSNWSLRAGVDSLDLSHADNYTYSVGVSYHF